MIQGISTSRGYLEVEVRGGSAESLEAGAHVETRLDGKPISRERAQEIITEMSDGNAQPALQPNRRREEIDRLIIEARNRFGLDAGDLIMEAYKAGRQRG